MSLKYEPSSEPLLISAKQSYLNWEVYRYVGRAVLLQVSEKFARIVAAV
jgi:hypothetical protein